MALGDVIARLSVQLGLETAAFESGSKKAQQEAGKLHSGLKKVGGAIAGAFAIDQLVGVVGQWRDMTKAALEATGALGETAAQLGVNTTALQEYRYAASQTGIEQGEMDKALQMLTKRLGEAAAKTDGPTAAAFKKLGVNVRDANGNVISAADAIPLMAAGYAKLGSAAEQAAIGTAAGGRAIQVLGPLMAEGAAGIEKMRARAHELGMVLSEEVIKNADKTADSLDEMYRAVKMQENAQLVRPENIKALVQYEQGISDLKLQLIKGVAQLFKWNEEWSAGEKIRAARAREFWRTIGELPGQALARIKQFIGGFVTIGREIVAGIARGIRAAPGAVWDALKGVISSGITNAKNFLGIKSPSRVFMEIGDYIAQGLAIGIEGGKGKVDAATKKLTEAARRAAEETQALFARLFPELEKANNYDADLKRIAGSGRSGDAQYEARRRLGLEVSGVSGDNPVSVIDTPALDVTKGLDAVLAKMDVFGKKAGSITVNVAKSFKDMADATVQSLGNLANSIKGGGFLDILGAVIGLGTQLGSIGVFGKKIAGRINAPARAMGGPVTGGRPYLVGERGPELVVPGRSGTVIPNHKMGGRGGVVVNINAKDAVLTHQVRSWVAEGMAAAADAGGDIGVARVGYRQRRRVA